MIDWEKADTYDIQRYGKWLNWALDWAEFKVQTNSDTDAARWRCEVHCLTIEQAKFREILFNRREPYATQEPSHWPLPTNTV